MKELPLTDRKLIRLLSADSRQPLSALGKKLRTNKQMIKYRLDKLQREGLLAGFYTIVDIAKLGYSYYLVYLKFEGISNEKIEQLHNALIKKPRIVANTSTIGKYDACIVFLASDAHDFQRMYDSYFEGYEKFIKEKVVCVESSANYSCGANIFGFSANQGQISTGGEVSNKAKDNKDIKILNLLSQNARMPLIELGQKTQLTSNAVKERIKRLKLTGIIKIFSVQLNYEKLGLSHFRLLFNLQNLNKEKEQEFIEFLLQEQSIISVSKTTGYSIECRVAVPDTDAISILIKKARERFKDSFKSYDLLGYDKFYEVLNYLPEIEGKNGL
jgi:DNA-binding Lrp family transcriptional regulator